MCIGIIVGLVALIIIIVVIVVSTKAWIILDGVLFYFLFLK